MAASPPPIARDGPILVVDDDPQLRAFVAMALADDGYRVVTASDGLTAVALAQRDPPVLALIDMCLPLMAGRDLAMRLREGGRVPMACVIMSGGVILDDSADGAIAAYLNKPFELEELLALVARHARPTAVTS